MIFLLLLMIVIDYLELSASLKCLPSIKCSLGLVKINMEKNALIIFISLFWLEQVILFFKILYVIKQYIQNIEISANFEPPPPQCIFNLYEM